MKGVIELLNSVSFTPVLYKTGKEQLQDCCKVCILGIAISTDISVINNRRSITWSVTLYVVTDRLTDHPTWHGWSVGRSVIWSVGHMVGHSVIANKYYGDGDWHPCSGRLVTPNFKCNKKCLFVLKLIW